MDEAQVQDTRLENKASHMPVLILRFRAWGFIFRTTVNFEVVLIALSQYQGRVSYTAT